MNVREAKIKTKAGTTQANRVDIDYNHRVIHIWEKDYSGPAKMIPFEQIEELEWERKA